jgi:hypothetical protein
MSCAVALLIPATSSTLTVLKIDMANCSSSKSAISLSSGTLIRTVFKLMLSISYNPLAEYA